MRKHLGEMLTVFVDSGWRPDTGAAGWGAWARRSEWPSGRTFGGALRSPCASASEAELKGIANVLWRLRADGSLEGISRVLLQCDSLRALELLYRHSRVKHGACGASPQGCAVEWRHYIEPTAAERRAIETAEAAVGSCVLLLRHVRGHQGNGHPRTAVNEACDREATRWLRVAAERQKEQARVQPI
jgi:ribonuclease HI